MAYARRRVPRQRLAAHLPANGNAGTSHYYRAGSPLTLVLDDDLREIADASDTGCAIFLTGESITLVVPPFPLISDARFEGIEIATLLAALEPSRRCAVFLLRLGGFAIGLFQGDELVDSKVDQRFVKNRHRKGGQSQRRFERIREKQIDELFKKACETARDKLTPHDRGIEHVFLGGDRRTLQAFRKRCDYFEAFGPRLRARVLQVAGDPRHDTLTTIAREMYSSDVYVRAADAQGES